MKQNKQPLSHITCNSRRPDLLGELDHMSQYGVNGLIYVCGPETMVTDCIIAAKKNGNMFRREYFLW